MRLHTLLLPLFLVAASCGGGENGAEDSGAQSGAGVQEETSDARTSDPLQPPDTGAQAGETPQAPPPLPDWEPTREPEFHFETDQVSDAELDEFYVEMEVSVGGDDVGTMTFTFWPEIAPQTVRNFLRYCDEGFYDGKVFHRIVRDFVIQGGSPDGTAAGTGPYGMIPGEFSDEEEHEHRYGVLSMARSQSPDSASSQFFVVCAETPQTVNLDGNYASFGRLVHGVDTLETIADVPTKPGPRGDSSVPTKEVVIESAVVKRGEPPKTEEVVMPLPDLGGEAERVTIQHVLVSFAGTGTEAKRSKEEAEELAQDLLERARSGEDFDALVEQYTDDVASKENDPPGGYRLLNLGVTDRESMKAMVEADRTLREAQQRLMQDVQSGEKTMEEAQQEFVTVGEQLAASLRDVRTFEREKMAPAFGDVAFSLEVGEIGMAEYDAERSPFGWHIIKRVK